MKVNNKSKIIPNEMKYNIDQILEEQLFNANRYYAESNVNISTLMNEEIRKLPSEFLVDLKKRWEWHNMFYEDLLEPAFLEIINDNINEVSCKQLEDLIDIYKTCCLVDEATLVMSGAIKKHLQYYLPYIPVSTEGLTDEEARFMLLTPPMDTFFTQYQIDHLSYIVLLKTDEEKSKSFKKYLINKYHSNDEIIFEGRFKKKFADKLDRDVEDLLNDINDYKIKEEYKVKHLYFTIEHPQRKAFRDIILYDNVDEKFISSQLIGISGFLLRKKILEILNNSNKLENRGYIYEFPNDVVISGLKELLEERKKYMNINIRPYKQRGMTCAISCMLMVLEYYKTIPKANWLYEKKYYNAYQSKYMEGTPFSAVAWHFAKNGFDTEIIHSEKNMFNNSQRVMSENMFDDAMKEYLEYINFAKDKGVKVNNGCDINCNSLRKHLEAGKIIILAGQCGNILHAILLCGYENDNFIVCDPLYNKKQTKTKEEIEKFMQTPIGKWCIVVGEKKIKKEELLTNIPKFQAEARDILEVKKENEKQILINKRK